MKKILCAVIALAMFATVCMSQAAFAENYVEVDRTDRNIAYLDMDSIKDAGDYITAVTKITLRSPEERAKLKERAGVEAHYILMDVAYDKAARRDQPLGVRLVYGYEVTGAESRDFSEENWREIPKGTVGAIIYDKLMNVVK